jgi:peptidoglycan/xylan/chitin deacetylase (PgdA/CDA1 family)
MDISYNARNIHATRMDHDHFDFSAFRDRPQLKWPNGARLAVMFVINVEFQDLIVPEGTWRPPGSPVALDVRNFSHRDYGPRVGLFRLGQILSAHGIPATVPISDVVLTRSPRAVEYIRSLGWELVGHGSRSNQFITQAMTPEQELACLKASYDAIKAATGKAPRGWMGPQQSESSRTPALAAKAGFDYTLDWGNDDQPYEMKVPDGKLMALPASVETADYWVIDQRNHSPAEFAGVVKDHFDGLYAESAKTGMAMTVNLQAHRSGQPFRSKYIKALVEHMAPKGGVWFATASEVTDAARSIGWK